MPNIKEWTPTELRRLRSLAIPWFEKQGRDLPWRQSRDPFAIWISEIMLQQTQVATVIPYYYRFLHSFPNVQVLATAPLDLVYQHWAGLGYYRRARQLHLAAAEIVRDHGGIFPTEVSQVRSLPGIGRYTAGAILSFAWDQRQPIVEANTQRLYARLLHLDQDTTSKSSQDQLWSFAERVLPSKKGSGQTNQALMEIGSQVCLPKNPRCDTCPLRPLCPTHQSGSTDSIPAPKKPKIYTDLCEAALILRDNKQRILLRRCASDERWAGLWDFPRFDVTGYSASSQLQDRLAELFQARFGRRIIVHEPLHQLKHSVTRYRITLTSYLAELLEDDAKTRLPKLDAVWTTPENLEQLALNSSGNRLWKWLKRHTLMQE